MYCIHSQSMSRHKTTKHNYNYCWWNLEAYNASRGTKIQQKFTDDLVKSLAEEMSKDAEKEGEATEETKEEKKEAKKVEANGQRRRSN